MGVEPHQSRVGPRPGRRSRGHLRGSHCLTDPLLRRRQPARARPPPLRLHTGSWLFDELLDHDAEWMEQETLDEGEERRAELQTAIDESREEGDTDDDQLDHAQQALDATPPWFLLLTDSDLEHIAHYTLPKPNHTPRLTHKYLPWTKPTPEMFLRPDDTTNRQHIVAAYLLAR
jgi:hypothetical protein